MGRLDLPENTKTAGVPDWYRPKYCLKFEVESIGLRSACFVAKNVIF